MYLYEVDFVNHYNEFATLADAAVTQSDDNGGSGGGEDVAAPPLPPAPPPAPSPPPPYVAPKVFRMYTRWTS